MKNTIPGFTSFLILALTATACGGAPEEAETVAFYADIERMAPLDEVPADPAPEPTESPEPDPTESPEPEPTPVPTETPSGSILGFWGGYANTEWFDFSNLSIGFESVVRFNHYKITPIGGSYGITTEYVCDVSVRISGSPEQGTIRFRNSKVVSSSKSGVFVNQACPGYDGTRTVDFAVYGDSAVIDGATYEAGE